MGLRPNSIIVYLIASFFLIISKGYAQFPLDEKQIEASLRMIGHQILLNSGDSISRVLPIIREDDHYRIQFEAEFEFMPDELVSTIDKVVYETKIANGYIVEVENCETGEMVYSFKMDLVEQSDIIPCLGRLQPRSCYSILFTIVAPVGISKTSLTADKGPAKESTGEDFIIYYLIIVLMVLISVAFYLIRKKRKRSSIDPNWIRLGQYYFDKRNTELIIEEQRIELTGKEADLLLLLYDSANTTVEREVILNMVWGDEGDYIGRTLDVFISKLRKKLEFDSKVKIVNTRGVGYKLILDI